MWFLSRQLFLSLLPTVAVSNAGSVSNLRHSGDHAFKRLRSQAWGKIFKPQIPPWRLQKVTGTVQSDGSLRDLGVCVGKGKLGWTDTCTDPCLLNRPASAGVLDHTCTERAKQTNPAPGGEGSAARLTEGSGHCARRSPRLLLARAVFHPCAPSPARQPWIRIRGSTPGLPEEVALGAL